MIVDTKALQRILVAVLAMLVAVLGGGLLLPKAWQVEREIVVAAPPPVIFQYLIMLRRWSEWSTVHAPSPDMQVEYSGSESGAGATRRGNSDAGRSVLKIMDTLRNRRLDYELLLDGGAGVVTGTIRLMPEDKSTRVTWRVGATSGAGPLERYVAFLDKHRLTQDIETSLARLKARTEPAP